MLRESKLAALGLALALTLVAGCSGSKSSTSSPSGQPAQSVVFHAFTPDNPVTFDPAMIADAYTNQFLMQQVYSGLVAADESGKAALDLAANLKVSEDGKTYTFTLKDGVKFHSGRALTSDDIKWSLVRAANPALASTVVGSYLNDIVGFGEFFQAQDAANAPALALKKQLSAAQDDLKAGKKTQAEVDALQKQYDAASQKAAAEVKAAFAELEKNPGIDTPDPRTVVFHIDAPKPYFLAKLTYPTAFAVDKSVVPYDKPITAAPDSIKLVSGTGPFKLTNFVDNSGYTLTRFDDYYGEKAKVQTVEVSIVIQDAPRLQKYRAGELDYTYLPTSDYQAVKADPTLSKELVERAEATVYYFALNEGVWAPAKDVRVRQAFNHAIDREALAKVVFQNARLPAYGYIPPGVPGSLGDQIQAYKYDPAKARELLKQAGYDESHPLPVLRITYRGGQETIQRQAEFLQQQIKQNLPIQDVVLDPLEWGVFLAKQQNNTELQSYLLGWGADYVDPQDFLDVLLTCDAPYNHYGYCNKQVDDLVKKGNVAPPGDARLQLYRQAEQLINQDAAWVPQTYLARQYMVRPYVKGLRINIMGVMPFNTVEIAPH